MTGQRGMALAVALLVIALTLTVAAAYLAVAAQTSRQDDAAYYGERAYQAADAGLAAAVAACSGGEDRCINWTGWGQAYPVDSAPGPTFRLTRTPLGTGPGGGNSYTVTATGGEALPAPGASRQSQRVLQARFDFTPSGAWAGATFRG